VVLAARREVELERTASLRGLSEALRVELADERAIHVRTLMPYAIDTPHFESGANHVGCSARPMPPIQAPEKVARALVALAERPRPQRELDQRSHGPPQLADDRALQTHGAHVCRARVG
jgi:NAD(P)-dependent dehydrogenase (short-subunit alcohol dehydrogenase family)